MAQGLQQDPGGWHLRGVKDDGKTEGFLDTQTWVFCCCRW